MRRLVFTLALLTCIATQSLAMKKKYETFPQSCAAVWNASVTVAKSERYRVVSISKEEQVISIAVGGAWWGERIVSLSLAVAGEQKCTVAVQSRYSGLIHSDAPDLLDRIHVELVGEFIGRDSKAFHKFERCVEHSSYRGCEEKLLRTAKDPRAEDPHSSDPPPLWNKTKPN